MSLYKIEVRRTVTQLLIIILVILQIIFIWHIDLCIGSIWRGTMLTNGFFYFDSMQIYHLCLYGVIIVSCLLGFAAARKSFSIKNYIKK